MRVTQFLFALALIVSSFSAPELSAESENRLADEQSPYLLQHASNPVDWYPWGEEAFERAKKEEKLIFLSIGYSTCHWCHVMEEESFSNEKVASVLNEDFISVKVDREERPDVDRLYMSYLQATTGSGGWPLNVILTPDLKPVFGGTYFPPETRDGRTGLIQILEKISGAWETSPRSLEAVGEGTMEILRSMETGRGEQLDLSEDLLEGAATAYERSFDAGHGGFGPGPKFPQPVNLNFLLRYHVRTGDEKALEMVEKTLDAIAHGGIRDHLGGGFHRYAVDREWRVPHFEKMLYDQAQLAVAFLEASQVLDEEQYRDAARETLDYVLERLTSPVGGFYSAEDADSVGPEGEKREGAYYVWSAAELKKLLGEAWPVYRLRYGIEEEGNVPASLDPKGELEGLNVLRISMPFDEITRRMETPEPKVREMIEKGDRLLARHRAERKDPHLDDKILAGWNGLMLSGFARASAILGDERYQSAATRAAEFLEAELVDQENERLLRRYRSGEAGIPAFADDYAFVIQGLLDLYESSFDTHWVDLAVRLQNWMDRLFYDGETGLYDTSSGSDPYLLHDMGGGFDAAEPSHNSIAALNLLRLGEITDSDAMRKRGRAVLSASSADLGSSPMAFPQMLVALDFALSKPKQIVIAGSQTDDATREMIRLVHDRFIPVKVLLLADGAAGQERLTEWLPFIEYMSAPEGASTVFVCENYVCRLPSSDPNEVAEILDGKTEMPKGESAE